MGKIKDMFRALKYRNFRLFFPGLALSQIGIWIQNVAISWLVYDITKSSFTMGVVMFCNSIPFLLITPFGGVIADKFNRQKLLMIVQILFAFQALMLTVLSFAGFLRIWNIILLGMFLTFVAAIDTPLRQATYVLVVDDKKDLGNAISLNSTCFNVARLLGPALGGMIIAAFSVKICFLINFLLIVPILFLVQKMKIVDKKDEKIQNETIWEGLKEGISYCLNTPQILILFAYLGCYCFLIMIYPMLMPIYTAEILHADADVLGFLLSAAGVGALTSSLLMAMKTTIRYLRRIFLSGITLACLCFIALGFVTSKIIAIFLMFGVGLGSTALLTPENMLVQAYVDDDKRGRVLGINTIAFLGTTAFSSLFAGSVAHFVGISNTFIILGATMLLITFALSFKLAKLSYKKG